MLKNEINDRLTGTQADLTVTEAVHRLMRSFRRMHSHGHRHPRGYHRLLGVLGQHEGASARELADLMDIRPASLAELLARMESDGFITRKKDGKDRRVHRIHLSAMGRAHQEEMKEMKADEPVISRILSSDERATLIRLCNKLSEGMAQAGDSDGQGNA